VSERRACRGVDFSRCSIRYQRRRRNDEQVIRKLLHELARQRPRFGYRQMTRLLRLDGFPVSFKRVHRIWRAEGRKVRRKSKKKPAKRSSTACDMHEPMARPGEKTTTATARTVRLVPPPKHVRATLLPNPYSHNSWIKNKGSSVAGHSLSHSQQPHVVPRVRFCNVWQQ
jgi:transposase InsO family protein